MENIEYKTMFSVENDYWWYRGLHDLVLRHVRFASGPLQTKRILDAGCGTGRMMELLKPLGAVEGFDISPEALRFCAQRGLKNVSLRDLSTWQGDAGVFDAIVCLDVLCHDAIHDEDEIIREFHRCLKPGGVLIVNLPAFELLRRGHDRAVHTRRRYRARETVSRYEAAGFTPRRATYRLPHLLFIIVCKKLIERLLGGGKPESDLKSLPTWLNSALLWCNRIENKCIASGITFPWGVSLFIVAEKR